MSRRAAAHPHLGSYGIALKPLGRLLADTVLTPPPCGPRTLELGTRHSPEFVCVPFKWTLGTFIEALEMGADVLVMAGGGCRLGYYGEVQSAILRDLGYEVEMVSLSNDIDTLKRAVREFRRLNPRNSYRRVLRAVELTWAKIRALDAVEDVHRRLGGLEARPGSFDAELAAFHTALDATEDTISAGRLAEEYSARLEGLPVERAGDVLRVGVVGEVYCAIEPAANMRLERELARRGVEVHRPVTLTELFETAWEGREGMRRLIEMAGPYLDNDIGTDGTKSVAHARQMMLEGFDGVVHVKPFGCIPEVNAVPSLQRLCRETGFPVLFLSFDSHTSATGVRTRIEAFVDMLRMRREAKSAAPALV